jgi:hypothetical protein
MTSCGCLGRGGGLQAVVEEWKQVFRDLNLLFKCFALLNQTKRKLFKLRPKTPLS